MYTKKKIKIQKKKHDYTKENNEKKINPNITYNTHESLEPRLIDFMQKKNKKIK